MNGSCHFFSRRLTKAGIDSSDPASIAVANTADVYCGAITARVLPKSGK